MAQGFRNPKPQTLNPKPLNPLNPKRAPGTGIGISLWCHLGLVSPQRALETSEEAAKLRLDALE